MSDWLPIVLLLLVPGVVCAVTLWLFARYILRKPPYESGTIGLAGSLLLSTLLAVVTFLLQTMFCRGGVEGQGTCAGILQPVAGQLSYFATSSFYGLLLWAPLALLILLFRRIRNKSRQRGQVPG